MLAIDLLRDESVRFGFAWLFLSFALALHVLDEALTDFLAVYNPAVKAIRERLSFLPLPTFTFRVWLGGLFVGIAVAFALSWLAFRRSQVAIVLAYPVAVLMLVNGLGHMAASLYRRRIMPGTYSSPLLVATSAFLIYCVARIPS